MRHIYDRHGAVKYNIRDDGTITERHDVETIGHIKGNRITDKHDIDTLYRIRDDGTVTDKYDCTIIGHIDEKGVIRDKFNNEHIGRIDISKPKIESHHYESDSYSNSDHYHSSGANLFGNHKFKKGKPVLAFLISLFIILITMVTFLFFNKEFEILSWIKHTFPYIGSDIGFALLLGTIIAIPFFIGIATSNRTPYRYGGRHKAFAWYAIGFIRGIIAGVISAGISCFITDQLILIYAFFTPAYIWGILRGDS